MQNNGWKLCTCGYNFFSVMLQFFFAFYLLDGSGYKRVAYIKY